MTKSRLRGAAARLRALYSYVSQFNLKQQVCTDVPELLDADVTKGMVAPEIVLELRGIQ